MSKGLEALERLSRVADDSGYAFSKQSQNDYLTIEKELKEKEKQENALKTISDIIRDFNKGEFASAEIALQEITSILSEVLL